MGCSNSKEEEEETKKIHIVQIYEDKHVKLREECCREIKGGEVININDNRYIYNKDGFYKPQFLLGAGKNN